MTHPDDAPERKLRIVTDENVIGAHYRRLLDLSDTDLHKDFFYDMLGKFIKIDGEPWAVMKCESEALFHRTLGYHGPGTLGHIVEVVTLGYAGRSMRIVNKGYGWYQSWYKDELI